MKKPVALNSLEQLGPYDTLLSHQLDAAGDGLATRLSNHEKQTVAVLSCADRIQLITKKWSASEVFSVLSKAEAAGYHIAIDDVRLVTQHLFNLVVKTALNHEEEETALAKLSDSEALHQFHEIIEQAVNRRYPASDIHAEFNEANGQIKLRINGFLEPHLDMLTSDARRIFGAAWYSHVKDKASDAGSSFQPDHPQAGNGRISLSNDRQVEFRWQSKPAGTGFDIIIRLLLKADQSSVIPLEKAGYHKDQLELIYSAANAKGGAIIISGDTGSGKSTTLAALMELVYQYRPKSSLVSLENPREYDISNVRQTTVRDSDFAAWLKVMLRCDYETLMTGEVRTEDEVRGFARSIMAGHQGLTTIHTADAMSILQRLEDLGVTRDVLGSKKFFNLLIHQYLIPTLCVDCRMPFLLSVEAEDVRLRARLQDVGIDEQQIYGHGPGCDKCHSIMGVAGRTVAAELIRPTGMMKKLIAEGRDVDAYELWASRYASHPVLGKPAIAHAIEKIKQGLTSPQLVEYMMGNLNEEMIDKGGQLTSVDAVIPLDFARRRYQQQHTPPLPHAVGLRGHEV